MKKWTSIFLFLVLPIFLNAQENTEVKHEMDKIFLLEKYIYEFKTDSANILLKQVSGENDTYLSLLKKIIEDKHTNNDLAIFLDHSLNVNRADKREKNQFINKKVKLSKSTETPEFDYVHVRSLQYLFLMNSNLLQRANRIFNLTEEYVNSFEPSNSVNAKKIAFLMIHSKIIYAVIQRDIERGEALTNRILSLAKELGDTCMLIEAENTHSEFIVFQGDLNQYISLMSEMVQYRNSQSQKCSPYYVSLFNLINAKIYRGDNNSEIIPLLNELYHNPRTEITSYFCIVEFMNRAEKNEEFESKVLNDFDVNDRSSLINKFLEKSESFLYPNDYYQLMRVSADLLKNEGQYDAAFDLKDESVSFIKTIYSKDLSNAISEQEIFNIEKEKEHELSIEKQKNTNYWYFSCLLGTVIGVIVLAFLVLRKKNKKLTSQKSAIEKRDHEKQILLKEIHHRVKNNFQIVSSLLQLQTKGIDDQNALNLAKDGQNRVKAMALIHQKLYQNDELNVPFQEYIHSLVVDINKAYSNIEIVKNIQVDENYSLDIDTSIPLGLILNELITNSFKYAFSPGRENKLTIELIEGDEWQTLTVSDNGKGIDTAIDLTKVKSIGLRLVKSLAKQLHGDFAYKKEDNAMFIVRFKETFHRELED